MPHKVRVTFDDESWEKMQAYAPTALNDPEMVRFFAGMGLLFIEPRTGRLDVSDEVLTELEQRMGESNDAKSDSEDTHE